MNEWELAPEQVLDVVKQSGVRCSVDTIEHKCKGTMTDYCTYAVEDAARAAAKKVVEARGKALTGPCPLPVGTDNASENVGRCHKLMSCARCKDEAFWRSLKVAVEATQ